MTEAEWTEECAEMGHTMTLDGNCETCTEDEPDGYDDGFGNYVAF